MTPPPDEFQPLEISPAADDPWSIAVPEPSTFIVFWPGPMQPMKTEIIAALQAALGVDTLSVDEPEELADFVDDDADESNVRWMFVPDIPPSSIANGLPPEFIIWCEPFQGGPTGVPEELFEDVHWIVGFETVLSADDPLTNYVQFMRLMVDAVPDARAILDVNSMSTYPMESARNIFLGEVEPPASCLWTLHVVSEEPYTDPDTRHVWLLTHGLRRCGVTELEMLDVDGGPTAIEAGNLINNLGMLLLDLESMPGPGEAFPIGPDSNITLQPSEELAPLLPEDVNGSVQDRANSVGEEYLSAAICAPEPVGQFREVWVWPKHLLEAMAASQQITFRTTRETARCCRLAQRSMTSLATVAARMQQLGTAKIEGYVVIKAALNSSHEFVVMPDTLGNTQIEHVWVAARSWGSDDVTGVLENQPQASGPLSRGDEVTVPFNCVSDWLVPTSQGVFGPDALSQLWACIDEAGAEGADA